MWVDDELADEEDDGIEEEASPIPSPFGSLVFVLTMDDGWIDLQLSNESVFNDRVDEEAEHDEDVDEEELIR
jgi:hypothetical protein